MSNLKSEMVMTQTKKSNKTSMPGLQHTAGEKISGLRLEELWSSSERQASTLEAQRKVAEGSAACELVVPKAKADNATMERLSRAEKSKTKKILAEDRDPRSESRDPRSEIRDPRSES
jgi:hypothetical protein